MRPQCVHPDFCRDRLSPHFVYESYDPTHRLFFNRGSMGFVLQGWPLVGTHLHAQSELTDFLKEEDNLPAGATLQIILAGSSSILPLLHHWASYRTSPTFAALAQKRIETLHTLAKEEGCIKDLMLFISITLPTLNHGPDQIIDMEKKRDVLKATYNNIGLYLEDVDDQILIRFIRNWFMWEESSHPLLNPYEPLSHQILPPDILLNELPHQVQLNQSHSIITLEPTKRPREWALPLMDHFIGDEMRRSEQIHSDFLLHFCLQIHPRQALEKSQDMAKREALAKSLKAGLSKWMPDLEEEYR